MRTFKNIAVLGAGESGTGAAILAHKLGMPVFVSDLGAIKDRFKKELDALGVEYEEHQHSVDRILDCDLIIKSPGIPDHVDLIKNADEKGIPVISEVEFAFYYIDAPIVAITGSNGKTTTTCLTHHLMSGEGRNPALCGNVGKSVARCVAEGGYSHYVVEMSSFQLDRCYDFRPDVAILLNITPDHLDRYESFDHYAESKFRIAQKMTPQDKLILNADDPVITEKASKTNLECELLWFSVQSTPTTELPLSAYLENEKIKFNLKGQFEMSIHDIALKGKHNVSNSLASGLAAKVLEIRNEKLRESLGDFKNVEHRLEFVARVHGIEFINDSKATNINSAWFALESMEKPTVWIVGGVDKGNDYNELLPLVKDKVKAIVALGKDNSKIIEAFKDHVERIVETSSAQEAVAWGYRLASKDETVLLSPACASFDLFENYEDRGDQFKQAVRNL